MTREEIKTENKKFEEYTKALKYVYADGTVSSAERARLITLKNELGLTDSDCQNLEGPYKLIAGNAEKNERTTFEDLCKCHHCHCFDHDGEIHFHTIDYSPIEYLEIGDTYIEITAAGFTGLKENFAVSIGQSFKDLIYEYGEEHIYDAVKDGKLQTFDDSCNYDDMVGWIITKFNILTQEEVSESYTNLLNRAFFPTKKLEINNAEQSLTDLANVIKNKSFLTLQNPELYRDIFEKNSFSSVAEFTTATMKDLFSPVEQQKRDVSINSSAFERMEKFFEGKHSELGNKDYQTFPELYDFIKEEFPNQNTLLEAVSRMVHSNVNFGDLEPASYDDVYGFGDGAEQRFDVSDDIAKRLINNEITPDWMTIQNEVNDFARRKFMDLKENNPDMLLTDTINEAFEISKKYNPLAEKDLNAYTKSEKTQNIQKALENIEKTYTEDSHDIRIDYGTGIFGADLEALIKGNDAAIYGEKSLDFVRPDRASLELGIEDNIPFKDLIRGYGDNFASALPFDSKGATVPCHIKRWDYMEVFDSDYDAAQQWKLETGGKLLENGKDIWISDENLEHYYPDTPENREALKEYLLPQPLEFNWDNFTEEQFNAVKEEITSGNIKEDYKGQVYVGSVCVEFTITDKESNWVDYNNYILGEKGEGEISGIPYSYQNGKQVVMNTFTENSYENFKTVIEKVLTEDLGKDSHLKQEAMRKTINWATINENNKEAAIKLWKEKEDFTQASDIDIIQKVSEFGYFIKLDAVWLLQDELIGSYAKEIVKDQENNFFIIDREAEEGSTDELPKPLDKILLESLVSEVVDAIKMRDDEKLDVSSRNFDVGFTNAYESFINAYESLVNFQKELEKVRVTHSVTFPCGFTFPSDLKNEAEMDAYRESQIEKIKEKYGCNDNEIESEIFDIDDPKNASFNIHFAVPVPEEISDNLEKVNKWIESVENFVKEECGCTFINWQGGERKETVYENAKEYKMEKERKSDFANPNAEIMNVLSDALADSFNTLDHNPDYWQNLLDRGADPTRAIRIAAADANLGDNLNWLLDNVPDAKLKEIFSDKSYAEEVFDIAKESVTHDEDSWQHISDIGFAGFKRIAVLCERETEADRYYGECLEKLYKVPVEPKISQLLDTPELLAGKMNANRIHQNEPEITESQAKAIIDYCTFENIKFYCDKNGDIFSLDVSEDYTGEGMKESNFGIAANGIEYANKAKDYAYSIYNEETYNVVKDLWEKEKIFANPAQEENYAHNGNGKNRKEPLEIVKEIADKKEIDEVPLLFKNEFNSRINKTDLKKDPFIVTKEILNDWKTSKPEYIPVLNEYLKKQGCSSKEGFEKFFKQLTSHNQNKTRHKENKPGYER